MFRTLALLLLGAAPLLAQLTPKQAVSQLKAAAKDEKVLLKGLVKVAQTEFFQDLEDAEALYLEGTFTWQNLVAVACVDAVAMQNEMHAALADSVYAVLSQDGVAALDGLGVDGDAFPLDFYFGQGGALDDAVAGLREVISKALAASNKRLAKTAKLLDKQEGVVLFAHLSLPDLNDHYTVNENGAFTWGAEALSVHTVFSASARDTAGDGVVCLAGRAYFGTVGLSFGGGSDFSDTADVSNLTWSWVSSGDVAEGNYVVSASVDADTSSVVFNVGVP